MGPSILKPENDSACEACKNKLAQKAIKCSLCSMVYHLWCTELAEIQIVRLFISRAGSYNCQKCIKNGEKYGEMLEKVKEICLEENDIIENIATSLVNVTNVDHVIESVNIRGVPGSDADVNILDESTAEEPGSFHGFSNVTNTQMSGNIRVNPGADAGGNILEKLPADASGSIQEVSNVTRNNVIRDNVTRTNVNTNTNKVRVCKYYARKECKYGVKGDKCPFNHPPKCIKFVNHGDRNAGCKKGKTCPLFHPPLCWNSVNHGWCDRAGCKYQHLRGTMRHRPEVERKEHIRTTDLRRSDGRGNQLGYSDALRQPSSNNSGMFWHRMICMRTMLKILWN